MPYVWFEIPKVDLVEALTTLFFLYFVSSTLFTTCIILTLLRNKDGGV